MIKEIVKDIVFLEQKSELATKDDIEVVNDLIDTLRANLDSCVGMAANMIGIKKRILVFTVGDTIIPMINPIILKKEMEKLQKNLGGIKDMKEMPGVMFVVDPKKERIAILEARKLDIPVIGLVDTNCNPEDVDYAIPGNDDAIRAVKLIADVMANAVIEGRQGESFENAEEQDISEEATDMEQVVEETAE